MRLYESRLKPLNQSILISTAASDRQPGLELDPWRKKRQQKPSTNRPDIRRRPTQSYEVAAQLKPASGFFSPPCLERYYSRIRFSDINLRSQSRDGTGPRENMAREHEWICERSRFMLELARGGKAPRRASVKSPDRKIGPVFP